MAVIGVLIIACSGTSSVQHSANGEFLTVTPPPRIAASPQVGSEIHLRIVIDSKEEPAIEGRDGALHPLVRLGCNWSQIGHTGPGQIAALDFSFGGTPSQLGTIVMSIKNNPVPNSTVSWSNNPLNFSNSYQTVLSVATSVNTPLGDYDVV